MADRIAGVATSRRFESLDGNSLIVLRVYDRAGRPVYARRTQSADQALLKAYGHATANAEHDTRPLHMSSICFAPCSIDHVLVKLARGLTGPIDRGSPQNANL